MGKNTSQESIKTKEQDEIRLNFQNNLKGLEQNVFIEFISDFVEKGNRPSETIEKGSIKKGGVEFNVEFAGNIEIDIDTQNNFLSNKEIEEVGKKLDVDGEVVVATGKSDRVLILKISFLTNNVTHEASSRFKDKTSGILD